MPRLVEALKLNGNPFENYVAEKEPNIAIYAVKPPYFEAIDARAINTSSFVLFGDRGAGKSATRLTIFKELWKKKATEQKVPLAVNMVDFSSVTSGRQITGATEANLIREVAFLIIESLLTWLSSLEDAERQVYMEAMTDDEGRLCYQLLRDYYLDRSEAKRQRSVREAMNLFNQAFVSKSRLWVEQRWSPIASLIGTIGDALSRRTLETKESVASNITSTISSQNEEGFDSALLLRRLVDLVDIFHFSGVVVLIDKVDETDATNNSAEKTAELIYPLLARVQLMEIEKFAWIFFLWDRVKSCFENETYRVRLDKIGHATVSWEDKFFSIMLDKRLEFFSAGRISFSGLFESQTNTGEIINELVKASMRSPREMVRLMDIIIREHDIIHANGDGLILLNSNSVQLGINVYVKDRISTIYGDRLLAQIFRLKSNVFTNKDVQNTFKSGDQSARRRIQSWEGAGIIKLTGTRAAEGNLGGKPANEYTIVDARIERVMKRQLISYDGLPILEEADSEDAPL